jgi:hypothetical protein
MGASPTNAFLTGTVFGTATPKPLNVAGFSSVVINNPLTVNGTTIFNGSTTTNGSMNVVGGILEVGPNAGGLDAFIDFHAASGSDYTVRLENLNAVQHRLRLSAANGSPLLNITGLGGITCDNLAAGQSNPVAIAWRSDAHLGLRIDSSQFGDMWPINVSGTAAGISDERLKTNITPSAVDASSIIAALMMIEFDWNDGSDKPHVALGFSAQSAKAASPDLVIEVPTYDNGDVLAINMNTTMAYVTKALQETIARVDALEGA